jgi:hypothetical protein
MKRKIIQITTCGVANTASTQCNQSIIALCDDGTAWELTDQHEWRQLQDIPQPTLPDGNWVATTNKAP